MATSGVTTQKAAPSRSKTGHELTHIWKFREGSQTDGKIFDGDVFREQDRTRLNIQSLPLRKSIPCNCSTCVVS
jgi:hypothetical protein